LICPFLARNISTSNTEYGYFVHFWQADPEASEGEEDEQVIGVNIDNVQGNLREWLASDPVRREVTYSAFAKITYVSFL
jgi:hypothetical protein